MSPKSPVSPTSPTENPWTRKSWESQEVKFSAIVEDEMQQTESLVRATNKPLALIQVILYIILLCTFYNFRKKCHINTNTSTCSYSLSYLISDRGTGDAGIDVPVWRPI